MLYYEDDFLSEDEAVLVAHSSSKRAVVSAATAAKATSSSGARSAKGELSSNDTHVSKWDTGVQSRTSAQRVRSHKSSPAASANISGVAAATQSYRQ
jgi:hypothetical protein